MIMARMFIALLLMAACTNVTDDDDVAWMERPEPMVRIPCECPYASVIGCGHRGSGNSGADNPLPENTIPSFLAAVDAGADMVEVDVLMSADGHLVGIHDATVDRTTDGSGCVGELTLAEIQALDAAVGTPLAGAGVRVATLDEILEAVPGDMNIEIKVTGAGACPAGDRPALAAAVVDAIHRHEGDRWLIVSSFDVGVLEEVKALDPSIYLGLFTTKGSMIDVVNMRGFAGINLWQGADFSILDPSAVDLNVWTINDEAGMVEALEMGASMVITDKPGLFAALRRELCACR